MNSRRHAPRILAAATLCATLHVLAAPTHAQSCGDANRSGSVTVTDGVLILRAAAGLGTVPDELCDMNQDRRITVADGVLALRRAAGLPGEVTCVTAESDRLSERVERILEIGLAAIPTSRSALAAQTTPPCADGGSRMVDDTGFEDFDCRVGDVVTNGRVNVAAAEVSYVHFSIGYLSSGETTTVSGELRFSEEGSTDTAEGRLNLSSNLRGDFVEELKLRSQDGFASFVGGWFLDTVSRGIGPFEGVWRMLQQFTANVFSGGVQWTDGTIEGYVWGDNLCSACVGSEECGAELFCLPCVGECRAATQRCGVTFARLRCTDGIFAPPSLCDPCQSASQCGEQLGCFPCSKVCSGVVDRARVQCLRVRT